LIEFEGFWVPLGGQAFNLCDKFLEVFDIGILNRNSLLENLREILKKFELFSARSKENVKLSLVNESQGKREQKYLLQDHFQYIN